MTSCDDSFEPLLVSLLDTEAPLRAALIYWLSEPAPAELDAFRAVWPTVPIARKRLLMSRLVETSETNFDVDFSEVALFALTDDDAQVRRHAIEALWENDHPGVMRRFTALLQSDPDVKVRASAATALGRFVLLGELEELEQAVAKEAEEALLQICHRENEELEVRRRAIESISYSSRKEVMPLIESAAEHTDIKMQASALFAMGRNSDSQWISHIRDALSSEEPELRFEAARAAGEVGLREAIPQLIRFAHSQDREIKEIAIWSLGEIGGDDAQSALFDLADSETDEYLAEAIEDAINMTALSLGNFGLVVPLDSEAEHEFEELEDFYTEQDTT
ncbi:MAG: HEAT repeat domain-containing protein [Anaerolineae bacterium]|nr:HEAT repeat domain-containing protein [Anaerolineae bacterium]